MIGLRAYPSTTYIEVLFSGLLYRGNRVAPNQQPEIRLGQRVDVFMSGRAGNRATMMSRRNPVCNINIGFKHDIVFEKVMTEIPIACVVSG